MERVKTGIEDLDEMLNGGIPQGCVTTIMGGYGTGKSTLALKFIHSGLVKGEKCLYISIDQKEVELINSSALFGWDFKPHIKNGTFRIIRLSPTFLKTTIAKIESELPELIKTFAPKRLVVDPITLYEMIFDNEGERREQLFKLIEIDKRQWNYIFNCIRIKQGVTIHVTIRVDRVYSRRGNNAQEYPGN
ncbi:MAG: resolvase/recombinase [Candidatus Methanoperedens nitroreducens]|uniref:Resolvase/recombinase n=1 Tax=Candidatus Methanoperedens nitratireducens TaxID=1392998 RepID=A0A0P8A7N6_9EURY|nr:MAG: resolvase/recombinase [Candidatus Methanoperedens sp. BLZ1]